MRFRRFFSRSLFSCLFSFSFCFSSLAFLALSALAFLALTVFLLLFRVEFLLLQDLGSPFSSGNGEIQEAVCRQQFVALVDVQGLTRGIVVVRLAVGLVVRLRQYAVAVPFLFVLVFLFVVVRRAPDVLQLQLEFFEGPLGFLDGVCIGFGAQDVGQALAGDLFGSVPRAFLLVGVVRDIEVLHDVGLPDPDKLMGPQEFHQEETLGVRLAQALPLDGLFGLAFPGQEL
mmetsp:Transcript_23431/g.51915  ORF Transcript_23431/g.51915 Transcript_23431/m.51915 type:complete len:229 (+) Transcript_23431:1044-1730(+)